MSSQPTITAMPGGSTSEATSSWLVSWPLVGGLLAYLYALGMGKAMLVDGDTFWHVATGRWIFSHQAIPAADPFSHTMPGTPWTAHEWLSETILAGAHQLGGWTLVAAVTGAAFALTVALLLRALLRWLEPAYALLFAVLAVAMTNEHLLARPHILAMPLLMIWTVELVRSTEEHRMPRWWMLPLMTAWANMHGGFTFGLVLLCAAALEALLVADPARRMATARSWAVAFSLAFGASLITPHGVDGLLFTWHVLFNLGSVLSSVGEWRSPDFHTFSALELWLLGGIALVLHQGLRLPLVRLLVLLGLLHMALKHVRYVELVGLLAPLYVAGPFAAQWREKRAGTRQLEGVDRFFNRLSAPAGKSATVAAMVVAVGVSGWLSQARPIEPPETIPTQAVAAAQKAGVTGPVLNSYGLGGYLIYMGIPAFIDGRADMYGGKFVEAYMDALQLKSPEAFEQLLDKHQITWTLLLPNGPAVALLDRMPGWKRIHKDQAAAVHVRVNAETRLPTAASPLGSPSTSGRNP
jgi:hypothetical protein